MSLIKCPECGKEFSEFANECPVCGMPTSKISQEKQNKQFKEESSFFSKEIIIKIVCSAIVILGLNILLTNETATVASWGIWVLFTVISYSIGILFMDYKKAFLMIVVGIFVLILPAVLCYPKIDVINSDGTHEKRHALYFCTKTPTNDVVFLAPTNDYVYNRTGKTLYLTSVGYGKFQFQPNKHVVIPNNSVEKGRVDGYFVEPSRWASTRSDSGGVWQNYLDYKMY